MKPFMSRLLLIPLMLLTGICSLVQAQTPNPGDPLFISGKVISFAGDSITLEVGDFQSGNTQQQTFHMPPAYPVVDAAENNVALQAGMMVRIEGVNTPPKVPRRLGPCGKSASAGSCAFFLGIGFSLDDTEIWSSIIPDLEAECTLGGRGGESESRHTCASRYPVFLSIFFRGSAGFPPNDCGNDVLPLLLPFPLKPVQRKCLTSWIP